MIYRHSLTFVQNIFLITHMKVKMGGSQAIDLYVARGVLFLFPSKLSVGL